MDQIFGVRGLPEQLGPDSADCREGMDGACMTDMEKRFLSGMKRLEEENRPKYFAMIAIFHALAGVGHLKEPSVFTRGDYKRAIRIIRVNQKLLSPILTDSEAEAAVGLIRREWLHRPQPTNRKEAGA